MRRRQPSIEQAPLAFLGKGTWTPAAVIVVVVVRNRAIRLHCSLSSMTRYVRERERSRRERGSPRLTLRSGRKLLYTNSLLQPTAPSHVLTTHLSIPISRHLAQHVLPLLVRPENLDHPILPTTNDEGTIARDGARVNDVPMTEEGLLAGATTVIPDFERLVGGTGEEGGGARGEGEGCDGVLCVRREPSESVYCSAEGPQAQRRYGLRSASSPREFRYSSA